MGRASLTHRSKEGGGNFFAVAAKIAAAMVG
jgi:hypothetical protein